MLAAQQGEHADAPSRALKDGQGGKRSVHLTTTETDGDTPPQNDWGLPDSKAPLPHRQEGHVN